MGTHLEHCFPCELCELKYFERIVADLRLKVYGSTSQIEEKFIIAGQQNEYQCTSIKHEGYSKSAKIEQETSCSLEGLENIQNDNLDIRANCSDSMLEAELNIKEENIESVTIAEQDVSAAISEESSMVPEYSSDDPLLSSEIPQNTGKSQSNIKTIKLKFPKLDDNSDHSQCEVGDNDLIRKKVQIHKCEECNYKTVNEIHLKIHISRVHRESCEATKRIKRKQELYSCGECHKTFNSQANCRRHLETVHMKIKKFKCTQCGVLFALKHHLQNHIISVHEKEPNL